jgi:hypothetical protein
MRGDHNWGVVAPQQQFHFCGGSQVEVDGIHGPDTRDVLPIAIFEGNHRFVRCYP